jgi:hypothetical protein
MALEASTAASARNANCYVKLKTFVRRRLRAAQ